jgi:hypothetical protein
MAVIPAGGALRSPLALMTIATAPGPGEPGAPVERFLTPAPPTSTLAAGRHVF